MYSFPRCPKHLPHIYHASPSHTGNEAQTRCFVLSLMQCVPRGWFSSRTTMRYPEVDGQTSWGTDANWWLMLLVPKSMVVLHLYPSNNAWVSEKARKPTPHSSNEWFFCRKHQEAMATQGSLHEGKLVDHEETRNPNLGPFFKWGQLSTADTMFLVGLLWNELWFHVNVVTVCLCTPFILLQTLLKATSFFTLLGSRNGRYSRFESWIVDTSVRLTWQPSPRFRLMASQEPQRSNEFDYNCLHSTKTTTTVPRNYEAHSSHNGFNHCPVH